MVSSSSSPSCLGIGSRATLMAAAGEREVPHPHRRESTRAADKRAIALGEILFRYEAPALADAANGALRRDAEH
jgi:hypothetical protein